MNLFHEQLLYRDQLFELMHRVSGHGISFEFVSKQYYMMKSGLSGEMKIANHLKELNLPFHWHYIIDFEVWNDFIQIDGLLITPHYIYTLEIKNISGIVDFDTELDQFMRQRADGSVDGFKNPINQLERNVRYLRRQLLLKGINIPIYGIVVFAYPSTIIRGKPLDKHMISFADQLVPRIENIQVDISTSSVHDVIELIQTLKGMIEPKIKYPLCEILNISEQVVRRGVRCVACGKLGMQRVKKGWICSCSALDKYAHLPAFESYHYLIGKEVNNKRCRDWLGLESDDIAYRLLKSLKCVSKGTTKGVSYNLGKKI
ncbi:nuclease-related domain-containing protein [Paenisporosarcina sp. TG20]|uniref:nuclease-related domain-containing protein n=1 Tax=Paenisporosarcina sp. TG20 TaxID=1211706 RepID=UPI0003111400|nr:nuclease-related domain-containing protein [Paenisporosarcina sp. TG20]